MEQTENIAVLKRAFRLAAMEARVLGALLNGVADAQALRAASGAGSHGALRKHMTRIRRKLPAGGIASSRYPTRYRLSGTAVECCRAVLAEGRINHEDHEDHEGHEGAGEASGRLRDLRGPGGETSSFSSGAGRLEGAARRDGAA